MAYVDPNYTTKKALKLAKKSEVKITNNPKIAAKNSDILYTDSWMSYHIKEEEKKASPPTLDQELLKEIRDLLKNKSSL